MEKLRPTPQDWKRFVADGRLETVLNQGPKITRAYLVWQNFWFGARRRRRIKNFPARVAFATPVHLMKPEVYARIRELVKFEKSVKDELEQMLEEWRRTPSATQK